LYGGNFEYKIAMRCEDLGILSGLVVCAMDLIGALVYASDFVVGGTSIEELYGVCEAMYKENMVLDRIC
jgi:hypothetical protein